MAEKIKVVWLCHFSNPFVHERLEQGYNGLTRFVKRVLGKPSFTTAPEFANWITNGIYEMEKQNDVELHVVSPYPRLKKETMEFVSKGIYYHFFRDENSELRIFLFKKLFHPSNYKYRINRSRIHKLINAIQPNIIHLFGAENPYYASAVLDDCGKSIIIAQLQTLMNDPIFKDNYPIDSKSYEYRSHIEQDIIKKADYIGTPVLKYRQIISKDINPDSIFLNIGLALKDPIVNRECEKIFDFVYFAANINKAVDLAIEAFAIVHKDRPQVKLDIIGGYDKEFKKYLDALIQKYNLNGVITFEGRLPTHEDVLKQIRKSRFALLPLKVDITSGTIREAMSNGLPVITTDTGEGGTQKLNRERNTVLISPIGNHQALADNMLRLLDNAELADTLRKNSYQQRATARSNEETIRRYVDAYIACLSYKKNEGLIPDELIKI